MIRLLPLYKPWVGILHIIKSITNKRGQGLTEYSLIIAFVVLIVVIGVIAFRSQLLSLYNYIITEYNF